MIENVYVYSEWAHRANWVIQHLAKLHSNVNFSKVDVTSIKRINKPESSVLVIVSENVEPDFSAEKGRFSKIVKMSFGDIFDGKLDKEFQ